MKRRVHSVLPLLTALPKPEPKPPLDDEELEALLAQYDPTPSAPADPWGLLKVKRGDDDE